jgi:hypothetical protein
MLQAWQIERCRAILASDHAINFEVRMVAEINLYWTVYEHLIEESVDLLNSVAALQTWKRRWEFVLGTKFHATISTVLTDMIGSRAAKIPISADGVPFLKLTPIRACS